MKLISDLIKIQSFSGNEEKIAEYIKNYLIKMGYSPVIYQGNVFLLIKGFDNKKGLILNAHMDTVQPGNDSLWNYPAYGNKAGIIKKGRVYGLGASDEKASIASTLLLAKELKNNKPKIDTWLTFVIKEEIDGSGSQSFINWFKNNGYIKKYKQLAAIICEPTNLSSIKIGHRGNIFIKITAIGDSGHGSQPEKIKTNAISEIIKVIYELENLAKIWEHNYTHPILGKPTIAITTIHGGSPLSPNQFAGSCSITVDIRTTPKLHHIAISSVKKTLIKFKVKINILYEPGLYGYTDFKNVFVKKVQQITKLTTKISNSSNDLCFFTNEQIPAVIFGPGNEEAIHQPNEYCEIKNIKKAVKVYQKIINPL